MALQRRSSGPIPIGSFPRALLWWHLGESNDTKGFGMRQKIDVEEMREKKNNKVAISDLL